MFVRSNLIAAVLLAACCLTGCQKGRDSAGFNDDWTTSSSGSSRSPLIVPVSADEIMPDAANGQKAAADEPASNRKENRLAKESSPYLLLHKHNPVDWFPWGPEAFEAAKKLNRPIFLSIGYSSCYWCHVMERQVFSDPVIARYMNEHFICVKVDREERPDIDDIYMTALIVYQQLSGAGDGGGWPLSLFLTPDGKPIGGGTYFPPEDTAARTGFPSVMKKVIEVWTTSRAQVEASADTITDIVRREMQPGLQLEEIELNRDLADAAIQAVVQSLDPEFGGLDFRSEQPNAPKFPVPVKLALLQYAADAQKNQAAEAAVIQTLDQMASGGIRDHLAGGFHRYSTDRQWRVPHFEKMLYDNAQLVDVYVEAFRKSGNVAYRTVAEETLAFIQNEMTDPAGGFYSAIDAETDGVEGLYYVWSPEEVSRELGPLARLFIPTYGLDRPSPFEHGHVLFLPQPMESVAPGLLMQPRELALKLTDAKRRLLDVRRKRKSPLKDDKILTSWNALMIRALADASAVLNRPQSLAAAEKAMMFVLTNMRGGQGQLLRTYREGAAKLDGTLDDYAFTVEALLTLHAVTRDNKWLNAARRLTDDQIAQFHDDKSGAFFFTAHQAETLLARTRNAWDGVLPSGNSVTVRNLLRLTSLTGEPRYRELAGQTLKVFAPQMKSHSRNTTNLVLALSEYLDNRDYGAAPDRAEPQPGQSPNNPNSGPPGTKPAPKPPNSTGAANNNSPATPGGVIPASGSTPKQTTSSAAPSPTETVPGNAPANAPQSKADRVIPRAFLAADKLPAGKVIQIAIVLDIADGWHINANPAHPQTFSPTVVTLESVRGTTLSQIHYPKPLVLPGDDPAHRQHVYEGRVTIIGDLLVPGEAVGADEEIQLSIQYQSCNDMLCERPKVVKFAARVPVAAPSDPVRLINEPLFRAGPDMKRLAAPVSEKPNDPFNSPASEKASGKQP